MTRVMRRTGKFLVVGLVLFAVVPGSSLQRWAFGGGRGERELYMKLPLQQPRFHWYFVDEPALLSGSLEIAIHGASRRDTTLTVFSDGEMAAGWSPISRDHRGIYFGFIGGEKIWTEAGDSVVVTLVVTEDLEGIGAYRRGILREGRYHSVASHSLLTGHPDFGLVRREGEPRAYIGCWRSKWQLDVIEEHGWMGAATEEDSSPGSAWPGKLEEWAFSPRGTDRFRCVE